MAEALLHTAHVADQGAFHVAAPIAGDAVSGALHAVYDDRTDLPRDWRQLLDSLNQID